MTSTSVTASEITITLMGWVLLGVLMSIFVSVLTDIRSELGRIADSLEKIRKGAKYDS